MLSSSFEFNEERFFHERVATDDLLVGAPAFRVANCCSPGDSCLNRRHNAVLPKNARPENLLPSFIDTVARACFYRGEGMFRRLRRFGSCVFASPCPLSFRRSGVSRYGGDA
jgi:hypothetical protein